MPCPVPCHCSCHDADRRRAAKPSRKAYHAGRQQGLHGRTVPGARWGDLDYLRGYKIGWDHWKREQAKLPKKL